MMQASGEASPVTWLHMQAFLQSFASHLGNSTARHESRQPCALVPG